MEDQTSLEMQKQQLLAQQALTDPQIHNNIDHPVSLPQILNKQSQFNNELLAQANLLFKTKKYEEAIVLYKQYIQTHFNRDLEIDGLGNYDQALGYYEWEPYQWYVEGINSNTYKGTALDALSLCYMKLRDSDQKLVEGMEWFKLMNGKFPDCYQFMMGYANILNNEGYFDDSIEEYLRIIEMKPEFLPPYECISYIYQFKRIETPKALQFARKALEVNKHSMVGRYVLAKNQKNIDERIERLKEFSLDFPRYSRGINMIGFVYGETKNMPEQAINWHKKSAQLTPKFDIAYHNIGMRYEQLKDYPEAVAWQIRACQNDRNYKLPLAKLVNLFDILKYSEQQIEEEVKKYDVHIDYFFYNLGVCYFDIHKHTESLFYYTKAEKIAKQLKLELHRLYNSIANTYFKMKKYTESIEFFNKSIALNPNFHMAFYNMANVYKEKGEIEEAKRLHKRSFEINPRYSYPYNNLGNIYVDQQNYDEAIRCYKQAVKNKSNYVLAMANLGVCYLKVQNYRDAFNSLSRAKILLEANLKDLSEGNKIFLRETLEKLNKEGDNWSKDGGITIQTKAKIHNHISEFQSNFHKLYKNKEAQKTNLEKVMKSEVIEIVRLVYAHRFQLDPIDQIYQLVKKLNEYNQEYFHIIPQLFIQYFLKSVFVSKRPYQQIEREVSGLINRWLLKTESIAQGGQELERKNKLQDLKLRKFNPQGERKLNLFKRAYFKDYAQIYNQILEVNASSKECFKEYKQFVDKVRSESKGIPFGVGIKIPKSQNDQFPIILRVLQKILKRELTQQKTKIIQVTIVKQICDKYFNDVKNLSAQKVLQVMKMIFEEEISKILKQRVQQNIETACFINDFLRAKIMFSSIDHLKKALLAADELCFKRDYVIVDVQNRLDEVQKQDVVLKIQIRNTVCELQLGIQHDQTQYQFQHSVRELQRSPLGCIYASYIFMSKNFNYPFLQNCRDIAEHLQNPSNEEQKLILEAAGYMVNNLIV